MPVSDRRYCIAAVHYADAPDTPEFLSVEGRIVVFDTLQVAKEVLPAMAAGRLAAWGADDETLYFSPLNPQGFNRITIWTGYDPYDVPNGFRSKGIYSEAEGRDWKHHIHWIEVWRFLIAWADKLEIQSNQIAVRGER